MYNFSQTKREYRDYNNNKVKQEYKKLYNLSQTKQKCWGYNNYNVKQECRNHNTQIKKQIEDANNVIY